MAKACVPVLRPYNAAGFFSFQEFLDMHVNRWIVAGCASVVILLAQIIVSQNMWIAQLRTKVDLLDTGYQIAKDQIQDLSQQLAASKEDNNAIGTRQFVAGVVAVTQNPGQYSEVWHDGYNRGTAVQQYAYELEKRETAYTNKQDADGEAR